MGHVGDGGTCSSSGAVVGENDVLRWEQRRVCAERGWECACRCGRGSSLCCTCESGRRRGWRRRGPSRRPRRSQQRRGAQAARRQRQRQRRRCARRRGRRRGRRRARREEERRGRW
eukprot:297566-Rhodomonas_salina.1